ncbi:Protein of unknown function [Austwickia chelonae]|uniref:DUF3037 domain-containing protein n=1 Tax=Austwickia chelonae NBRC 105200 TaxID=1184607 RepID=K6ULP1_9MICO|nr:DUF3037 domain-containing protein [Austwickia chelonae]GAB77416.1 hypothetical protein AUCHE_05_03270 [Austwickia chelonae NBRC 105200]SEW09950.1 Protein of unknown function [Austwickia chelonae]
MNTTPSLQETTRPVPYQYIVLRCLPRVEREEFVNVAVVLFCQETDFLDCAWTVDDTRTLALCPGLDVAALRSSLEVVRDICAGHTGRGRPDLGRLGARFGWLRAPRSTVLQPGPVHGGICVDPRQELDRLVDLLVR